MEANIFIFKFGWVIGGAFVLLANIGVIWLIIHFLQRYRYRVIKRFSTLSAILGLVFIRLLVVISNFYFGSQELTQVMTQPPSNEAVRNTWLAIGIPLILLYIFVNVCFRIYVKNYNINYVEKKVKKHDILPK